MMQSNFRIVRLAMAGCLAAVAGAGGFAPRAFSQAAGAKPALTIEALRQRAEAGDAQAQMTMGWRYDTGTGVSRDASEALGWYRQAAAQGDATAQSNIGLAYHQGRGVAVDLVEAKRWYLMAAEQKFPQALHNLGLICAKGARPQDQDEAMSWFISAAELGYEPSKAEIAKIENAILARASGGNTAGAVARATTPVYAPVVKVDASPAPAVTPAPVPTPVPAVQPNQVTPANPITQGKPVPVQAPKPVVLAKVEPVDPSLRPPVRPGPGEAPTREAAEPLKWYQMAAAQSGGAIRTVPDPRPGATPEPVTIPRDKVRDAGDVPPVRAFYSKASPQPVRYDGDENDRRSFEVYLNSSQDIERDEDGRPLRMKQFLPQAILDGIHTAGTARSIKVHDLVVKWKKDRPTGNFEDIIEYSARLTLFWRSPQNPDGFTKLNIVYDAEIERYTRGELLVTNGALKRTPIFQVGQGSGVPLVIPE